jgi:hypothetical protein
VKDFLNESVICNDFQIVISILNKIGEGKNDENDIHVLFQINDYRYMKKIGNITIKI